MAQERTETEWDRWRADRMQRDIRARLEADRRDALAHSGQAVVLLIVAAIAFAAGVCVALAVLAGGA